MVGTWSPWRDQKLSGNDRFDDEIVDQLVKAAVLDRYAPDFRFKDVILNKMLLED